MPYDILTILLLPAILFVGIVTSYDDIKNGRIRNKWIVFSLIYSLVALFAVILLFSIKNQQVSSYYILLYFANIAFALLSALFIWSSRLWSAGDAKLFLAYAALMPLAIYKFNFFGYFPSFVILVNTFIPLFIFYLFKIIFGTKLKLKIKILKSMANLKFLYNTIPFVFAFSWLSINFFSYLNNYFSVSSNVFLSLLFLFVVLLIFNNILKIDYKNISSTLSIIAVIFDYKTIFSINFAAYFFLVLILFIGIRYFILNLAYEAFSYPIYIEDLKPGMAIAENFFVERKAYKKSRIDLISFIPSFIQNKGNKFLLPVLAEGLSKQDADKIKKMHGDGYIKEHTIRIFQTVPFSPFMFLGVILTILFKGSIFL